MAKIPNQMDYNCPPLTPKDKRKYILTGSMILHCKLKGQQLIKSTQDVLVETL